MNEPFRLLPACKPYLWGGDKLKTSYNKSCDISPLAEAWELSCHKDGSSIVADGADAGMTLPAYIEKAGAQVLGTNPARFDRFPVLVKLIDAKQALSVQVHPGDDYALRVEGEYGKTEMWYIVDCGKDARLLYGFDRTITKDELRRRIGDNTLLDVVKSVPVHKGDVFFIEAGTLHAIGEDIVIAEIQQNSNTTYRIYDYGRRDADGNLRELHIEKAIDVTDLHPVAGSALQSQPTTGDGWESLLLSACKYFTVNKYTITKSVRLNADETSFHHLLCVQGSGVLDCAGTALPLVQGGGIFVPANAGSYTVSGACEVLVTTV